MGGAPELFLQPSDWLQVQCFAGRRGLKLLKGVLGSTPSSVLLTGLELLPCLSGLGHPVNSRGPQIWCKVNFNYCPGQADELKLQSGEIVEVIKEVRGCEGTWKEEAGALHTEESRERVGTMGREAAGADAVLGHNPGWTFQLFWGRTRCSCILPPPQIEDGWWLGKKNGQLGAFPSNFVELLDSGSPSETVTL